VGIATISTPNRSGLTGLANHWAGNKAGNFSELPIRLARNHLEYQLVAIFAVAERVGFENAHQKAVFL
jgi:hypothetical protein